MKLRITLVIFLLTGIINISSSQIKMMDESDMEIKKVIESFITKDVITSTLYRYDIDSGVVGTEPEKISKTVIDLNNRILSVINFYPNYSRTIVSFNESKDITDITIYYADNSIMSRIKTNYNKDKKVSDKIYYFGSSFTFKVKNIYSSGNIIGQEYLDSLGKKLNYSKIFYDNSGNLLEEDKYNLYDSLEIAYSYLYDGDGNCTEELITYPASKITSKTVKKYDSEKRLAEKINYGIGDKISSRNVLKYDAKGNLTGDYIYALDDKLTIKNEFSYDEKGNRTEWRYLDALEDVEYFYKIVYNEK